MCESNKSGCHLLVRGLGETNMAAGWPPAETKKRPDGGPTSLKMEGLLHAKATRNGHAY